MLINRVSRLMGERKENIKQLSDASGVSYGTAYALYKGTTSRIDFGTLDRLCNHFNVGVGDILEYQPGSQRTRQPAPGGEE